MPEDPQFDADAAMREAMGFSSFSTRRPKNQVGMSMQRMSWKMAFPNVDIPFCVGLTRIEDRLPDSRLWNEALPALSLWLVSKTPLLSFPWSNGNPGRNVMRGSSYLMSPSCISKKYLPPLLFISRHQLS